MRVSNERGEDPRRDGKAWMEVRGVFDEPVKGQKDVVISVHEDEDGRFGPVRPAVVGYMFQMRPECRIVVTVTTRDFERAWTLAAGGRLTHAWLSMTVPRYNDAEVPSVAFSNEPIE
jgi:hypothetical protein